MKKVILLCAVTCLLMPGKIFAQAIPPNGGFENWTSTSYNDPFVWFTGNEKTLGKMGVVPVTKVTGQTGFAVRIETTISGGDTSQSYIDNSPTDPTKGIGGVPFSQQPTSFTGYYRDSVAPGDTAVILVFFKKGGLIISPNLFYITGVHSLWTLFSFPLSLATAPDTVIIAAVSSNLLSGIGIHNGSWLELDGLAFGGATQGIPNGAFENWNTLTYETPTGWEVQGDSISKTTDKYSGTYAIRLKTALSGDGHANPSGITTGHNTNNGPPTGGQPYTRMADTLMGYYKYVASGVDTGVVSVNLSKNFVLVGGMRNWMWPTIGYIYFEVPFSAGTTPDTIRIDAYSSSSYNVFSHIGSTLYLDNLALKSQTLGITEVSNNNLSVIVYPNPANNVLNVSFRKSLEGTLTFRIYDVSGRLVKDEVLKGVIAAERIQLNIADLSAGIYHYQISGNEGVVWNKFMKN